MESVSKSHPVVVIGGGIAGLTAAWELKQKSIPVKLIEATPHLGGRIDSLQERGACLETGMQFYYGAYKETFKLLRHFKLDKELVKIHLHGLIYWQDRVASFNKSMPWLKILGVMDNLRLQFSIGRKALSLLSLSMFEQRLNDPLDVDVAQYFLNHGNEKIFETAIRPMVNSYAFCEPEGHSLAILLKIVKLGALAGTYGLRGGNDLLPKKMAEELEVVTGQVTEVVVEKDRVKSVVFQGEQGEESIDTNRVICGTRAHQAGEILSGIPPLSEALQDLKYSTVLLINLHLDRPLEGREWVYVFSRKSNHKAAFAIDLLRRSPTMFPQGNSVLQVVFASSVSEGMMDFEDQALVEQAIKDLTSFLPEINQWVQETSVVRRPRVLPNFPVGTFAKVEEIRNMADSIEGLKLVGDYLRVPMCEGAVRSAKDCVDSMLNGR